MRLQRFLALSGLGSRRACEQLILDGYVVVNGQRVEGLPAFVDPDQDVVCVRGRRVQPIQKVYYLLNKPKGVICTNYDPVGRPRAVDLVPPRPRVFCVGRLESDTTGCILLTNDTDLAARLSDRRCPVTRTYLAAVRGRIEGKQIDKVIRGACLANGRSRATAIRVIAAGRSRSVLEIEIAAGLHCHVRKLLLRVGLDVLELRRSRFGPLLIKGLGLGHWRPLTAKELAQLNRAVSKIGTPSCQ